MKRFLLFIYDRYYPKGGMLDFAGDFETIEEAKQAKTNHPTDGMTTPLYHIYDCESNVFIETNDDQ